MRSALASGESPVDEDSFDLLELVASKEFELYRLFSQRQLQVQIINSVLWLNCLVACNMVDELVLFSVNVIYHCYWENQGTRGSFLSVNKIRETIN